MNRNIKKTYLLALSVFLMVLGAGVQLASAALGDNYPIGGYNAGYYVCVIGVIFLAIAYFMSQAKGSSSKLWVGIIGLIVICAGLGLIFVEPATVTEEDDDEGCCDFQITGTAITSGGNFISGAVWDETLDQLKIPLNVNDSSEGNLNGGYKTGVNISLTAKGASNEENYYFSITCDLPTYGGEDVVDESGTNTLVEITTKDGVEYVTDDTIIVVGGETEWINVTYTFINGTSGSWVSEFTSTMQGFSWGIEIENACGVKETITMVTNTQFYTA